METMHPHSPGSRRRLRLTTAAILLVGLGSALLIYLTAGAADEVPGFEPESSKAYLHDLELYGGKANLLADEFMRWFAGLWHGRQLAFTVGCLTLIVSAGYYFVASQLAADREAEHP